MASSSFTGFNKIFLVNDMKNSHQSRFGQPAINKSTLENGKLEGSSSVCGNLHFPRRSSSSAAKRRTSKGSNRDLFVRNATPESAAGDILSSLSIPGISGLSDNPWLTGLAGLLVLVPFVIQRLLTLTKEIDIAAETVEKIADTVGKVAEEVDKAAEEMIEKLPEGGLKKVVSLVEDLAEETVKDAQKVEDLMDKIEELDDKVEAMLNHQSKDINTEKA